MRNENKLVKKEEVKHGGKRKGAGRKKHYSEQTVPVSFKCPKSKVKPFKKHANSKLAEWSLKNSC